MDEFYIAALENLERQENAVNYRKLSHSERFDAFLLPNYIFINNYRLTKDLVRYVINILTPHMTEATKTSALNIQTKVFIALNFFATGSYQLPVGNSNLEIVSQPTVSRAIDEVVNALNQPEIFKYWVKYPSTLIELRQTREKFNTKYNFPGIVGIIDCTHIGIFPPKTDDPVHPEYMYVNRKNYHSINVQLVCDSDMKIINVSALFPGSVNNAYIWNNSLLEPTLRRIYNYNPEGFYLLGDSGYPLRPWLMTPLMQYKPNTPEERYNRRFKHVRSLIERLSRALEEFVNALNEPTIFNSWVKYPSNFQELRLVREEFFRKFNFPGIVGVIDCTHIAIFPPPTHDAIHPEYIYVNRKNYHSINVQLVCDSKMKMFNICSLFPGSVNDAYIWNNCQLEPTLRRIFNHEPGFYLLGDSGYPLRAWLMTPL
ncbi:unnamed protein product [Macrosiphum euphorbiae]|uniref:DDE Tnp4 domain-containing protein n=1 Tax=Macrosiphum euphorbiae TaxID=13131 RepID=A0AAV0WAK7_9HEMI|nr:unnamed protein product [Macrosiphum euphorbiae]